LKKLNVEPLRGFRDIFFEEAEVIDFVMKESERLARRWGFKKCFLPTLERFELFAMKSGVEIEKTMYVFKDKAGRTVALRPEATASVVRAYLRLLRAQPKPLKLFTVVNVFRYDEPQYARYREFYQADFEVFGSSDSYEDAELITMLHDFYENLGLRHEIVVGSVKALRTILSEEGVNEKEQDVILHLIDKGKVDEALERLEKMARNPERAVKTVRELVSVEGGEEVLERGVEIMKQSGYGYGFEDLLQLTKYLPDDVKSVIKIKLAFARGLAYYTGLIYEVKVPGFPVSVAGGGRYDTLTEVYGWERVPATGFAIGIDRTALALSKMRGWSAERPTVVVIPLDEEARKEALAIARELASLDVDTILLTEKKSIKKMLAYASEKKARVAIILGKREISEGKVTVKNLDKYKQVSCPRKSLLDCLADALKT